MAYHGGIGRPSKGYRTVAMAYHGGIGRPSKNIQEGLPNRLHGVPWGNRQTLTNNFRSNLRTFTNRVGGWVQNERCCSAGGATKLLSPVQPPRLSVALRLRCYSTPDRCSGAVGGAATPRATSPMPVAVDRQAANALSLEVRLPREQT